MTDPAGQRRSADWVTAVATAVSLGTGVVVGGAEDVQAGGVVAALGLALTAVSRGMWAGLAWLLDQATAPGEQWRTVAEQAQDRETALRAELAAALAAHSEEQQRREQQWQDEVDRLRSVILLLWTTTPDDRPALNVHELLYPPPPG